LGTDERKVAFPFLAVTVWLFGDSLSLRVTVVFRVFNVSSPFTRGRSALENLLRLLV
jgi:hypothetical protein